MKVLVSAASKYGATAEIAHRIGAVLADRGLDVAVIPPEEVGRIERNDAVVLGSAVYAGRWMRSMKELVEGSSDALLERPVWLFSSGPIGDPPRPEEDPVDVAEIVVSTNAREHRVFAGKLVKSQLSFGEKAIVLAFRTKDGDFRDWAEVERWATEIADALTAAS